MTTERTNRLELAFDEGQTPEAAPAAPVFVASLARNGASARGFYFNYNNAARRAQLAAGLPDIDALMAEEQEKAFWEQFMRWLNTETENFDKFFGNPAQHFSLIGITPDAADTFNAATAFSNGFKLTDFQVGRDKLTIEPSKITIEVDINASNDDLKITDFPVEGVLASIALALKNPNFKDKPITITGDEDLVAFTYAAFKAAGLPVKNAAEIEAKLANSANTEANNAASAWTEQSGKPAFKAALELFPELKSRFEPASAAAPQQPADAELGEGQPAATATTTLAASLEALKQYGTEDMPAGTKDFRELNKLAPTLSPEDFQAIEDGTYTGELNDMRASAITGLLRGVDKQENMIVGQILMRAIQAAVKHSTAPVVEGVPGTESDRDHFEKFLLSKGVEPARAKELTDTLHAPLKAAIDALDDIDIDDRGTTRKFKNLHSLPADVKKALSVLVESQHNPVSGVKEHFFGTSNIVERLLNDDTFINNASKMIAGDFVSPDVGVIGERVFGYSVKTDHAQTKTDGTKEGTPSKVDIPNEVGQAWIALYRIFAKPEAALESAKISDQLQHAPFSVIPQTNERQNFVLQEAATAQYAALLIRGIANSFPLGSPDRAQFQESCTAIVYGCAKNAIEILDGYTPPEEQGDQFVQGLATMRAQLQGLSDVAGDGVVNATAKKLYSANHSIAAKALGDAIVEIEKLYLKAAASVPEATLKANVEKLSKWRKSTVASFAAANFAAKQDDAPEAVPGPAPTQAPQ
ncbi:MAG: hypothetical protein EBQ96_05620 [Proteobacteria bacterium]|nr:hypothetical protein [Pseudomonadota bacterium]